MCQDQSVTHWIAALRKGDEDAARKLWSRYFERLTKLARQQLRDSPRRVADEEDVALVVFDYLCDSAKRGHLDRLSDREELWRLLVKVTIHKVIQQRRYLTPRKRGEGKVRGDSVFYRVDQSPEVIGFDALQGKDASPEFLAQIAEQHDRLLAQLKDDTLRAIVLYKLDGMNNEEIAAALDITSRSVRRKMDIIRGVWRDELSESTT